MIPSHDPRGSHRTRPGEPELSVIVLTLNEQTHVEAAVRSLLAQEGVALEVVVIDSASTDRTVQLVRRLADEDERVRLIASRTHLSVGRARNVALQDARASFVAFMSADATAAPGWARAAMKGLEQADVVYGRQVHAPGGASTAGVVRGLRYHHFDRGSSREAQTFASNVNAAIRREVFRHVRYVDDGPASALDDILFTREAMALGHSIAYRDDMLVRHKDAVTMRQEFVKNRREGRGWGLLAPRLGLHRTVLAWGAALVAALGLFVAAASLIALLVLLVVLYAPTLRRAARGVRLVRQGPLSWTAAVVVSPLFDLTFLFAYLAGLRRRRSDLSGVVPQGV